MARKSNRKLRPEYYEPWTAQPSKSYLPLNIEAVPEDAALEMQANRDALETTIPWIIWGSGMTEPGNAVTANGQGEVHMDNQGIVARIEYNGTLHAKGLSQQQVAQRICACINACADVPDPMDMRILVENLELELDKVRIALKKETEQTELARFAFRDLMREYQEFIDQQLGE